MVTCKATLAADKNAVGWQLAQLVQVLPLLVENGIGGIPEPTAPLGVCWVDLGEWWDNLVGVARKPRQVVAISMDPAQEQPEDLVGLKYRLRC